MHRELGPLPPRGRAVAPASAVPAASAGTHPADRMHPGAIAVAGGTTFRCDDRPRRIEDLHTGNDLVITVCDLAHEDYSRPPADGCTGRCPTPSAPAIDAAFDRAFDDLTRRVDRARAAPFRTLRNR